MNDNSSIFGCFVSITCGKHDDDQTTKDLLSEQGDLFRRYIWGEKGICKILNALKYKDYGRDLILILFQFYVNPLPIEVSNLPQIERYKKKEKAIGIPIVVNSENFFSKPEEARYAFLKQSIFQGLKTLNEVVKKKKLDTKAALLKLDLEKVL